MSTIMSSYRQKYENKVVSKLETIDLYASSNKVQGQFSFMFYAAGLCYTVFRPIDYNINLSNLFFHLSQSGISFCSRSFLAQS